MYFKWCIVYFHTKLDSWNEGSFLFTVCPGVECHARRNTQSCDVTGRPATFGCCDWLPLEKQHFSNCWKINNFLVIGNFAFWHIILYIYLLKGPFVNWDAFPSQPYPSRGGRERVKKCLTLSTQTCYSIWVQEHNPVRIVEKIMIFKMSDFPVL